jgi:hypothetical protein
MFRYPLTVHILTGHSDPCLLTGICRRWRWRRHRGSPNRHRTRDLVSLGIHALLIGNVIAPLELITGHRPNVAAHCRSADQTSRSANRGAGPCITRGSSYRHSESSPNDCTEHRSTSSTLIERLARRCSSDLLLSPLSAKSVIRHEYVEGLSRSWEHRNRGACRYRCTSAQHCHNQE